MVKINKSSNFNQLANLQFENENDMMSIFEDLMKPDDVLVLHSEQHRNLVLNVLESGASSTEDLSSFPDEFGRVRGPGWFLQTLPDDGEMSAVNIGKVIILSWLSCKINVLNGCVNKLQGEDYQRDLSGEFMQWKTHFNLSKTKIKNDVKIYISHFAKSQHQEKMRWRKSKQFHST